MELCRNHWTKNHLLLLLLSFFVFDFVDFSAQNQPQQEWNGIVRELLDRKADIAVAPMTINFARFVTLKYNVLYRKVVESILFSIIFSELRFVKTVATGICVKFLPAV